MAYNTGSALVKSFVSNIWELSKNPLQHTTTDLQQPKAPLANNVRPVQELNGRSVRTNVKFERRKVAAGGDSCPEVVKDTDFKANSVWAVSPVPEMANPYMRGGAY